MAKRPARPELDEPSRGAVAIPIVLTVVAIALAAWRLSRPDPLDVAVAPAGSSSTPEQAPALPPRCIETSAPYVVGELPAKPPVGETASSSGSGDPADDVIDPLAPYAVEVGRGAAFDGGFAAGVLREGEGGSVALVATLRADGSNGALIRLGRSRADFEAPVVAGAGSSVLAVMIEPNASGRSLKVAKITNGEIAWGPSLNEGRDDSLAMGVASTGTGAKAIVVWDDISGTGDAAHANVMLSAFDVATMKSTSLAHVVSPKDTDANTPHVTSRPGGYWLAYLARGEEDSKKRKKHHDEDDDDQRDQGEAITTSWVEVIPLDEDGAPIGGPRAVTPKSGHVLSFDLVLADNGNALVAFRDNDTPAGGAGGKVSATLVRLGGGGEPHVLFDQGGTGSPDLLPGWISIASVSGATRIAGVSPMGDLLDDLASEPALGAGEPIAARGDAILWARPLGKAMRLSMVRCHPRERAVDAGEANAGDGGA